MQLPPVLSSQPRDSPRPGEQPPPPAPAPAAPPGGAGTAGRPGSSPPRPLPAAPGPRSRPVPAGAKARPGGGCMGGCGMRGAAIGCGSRMSSPRSRSRTEGRAAFRSQRHRREGEQPAGDTGRGTPGDSAKRGASTGGHGPRDPPQVCPPPWCC